MPSKMHVKAHPKAVKMAKEMMTIADLNRNKELSFTELTQMLENSAHQAFGRWIKQQKQAGFRAIDTDMGGNSSQP